MGHGVRQLVALVVLFAACGVACNRPVSDPVVDGWPIGPPVDCATSPNCAEFLAAAEARLAVRDPGHSEVVKATLHTEGGIVDADGNFSVVTRSGGCCSIARFELADGTVKALGVGYPGISQRLITIDFGP